MYPHIEDNRRSDDAVQWARCIRAEYVGVQSERERAMKSASLRIGVIAVVATIGSAAALVPIARSQIQAGPSYVPIGVAASGSSSMAWFHHPASGRVLACEPTSNAGSSTIQCIAAKLP